VTSLTCSVHAPASEELQVPTNTIPVVAVLFGWPAVVLSLALTLTGIAVGRWRVALVGTLIGSPFLLYLFGSPRIGWLSLLVGGLYLGSAQAVARSHRALAFAMATPFVLLAGFIAWLVLNQ
jgi:hypothetical protein